MRFVDEPFANNQQKYEDYEIMKLTKRRQNNKNQVILIYYDSNKQCTLNIFFTDQTNIQINISSSEVVNLFPQTHRFQHLC